MTTEWNVVTVRNDQMEGIFSESIGRSFGGSESDYKSAFESAASYGDRYTERRGTIWFHVTSKDMSDKMKMKQIRIMQAD